VTERDIFLALLDLPDAASRSAYLDTACAGDAALRAQVEALLRSHDTAGSFLGTPARPAPADPGATQSVGDHAVPHHGDDAGDADLSFLTPATRPDSLGRIGHYEVLQVLGRGGFGIVFRAFDETLQRVVALKVMAPQLAATSPARKRFLREARSSAQVRHENVVQVYEVAERPLPYLAMEFIPGETLQQKLDRVGPLDVPETLRIGRQIAEGLAAAHAMDLIHRDIKPGNVLLESGQQKVKITDFGLARTADDASISQSGIIAGTPMYMAPEQAQGQPLDQRADLFSLGSVLYQMVAGRPPFRANTTVAVLKRVAEDRPRAIREIIPETPQWLCDIIARLHAKDPDDRYQSAREVADVLADCEAKLKANARLKDFPRIPNSKPRRSGRRKWLVAAALLLPVLALLVSVLALAVTETAGITHLLRQQATSDPTTAGGGRTTTAKATPDGDGWVQLFNGKDLTGWKYDVNYPGTWKVEDGILTNAGSQTTLFLERTDLKDFHLRLEAKVSAGGSSGVYFRGVQSLGSAGEWRGPVGGPGIQIQDDSSPAVNFRTGGSAGLGIQPSSPPIKPGEWFLLEILVCGNAIETRVNGHPALETKSSFPSQGTLALHHTVESQPKTVVQFRKIEIKDLPPSARTESGAKDKPASPAVAPFTDADVQRIAALPAEQQVEEVRKELMRRNPGFDGTLTPTIENGVVTGLKFPSHEVDNIEPVRALKGLTSLDCRGTHSRMGKLWDLSPLKGMALTSLDLSFTQVRDLGRLKGMPLRELALYGATNVADLTPLKGMKLQSLAAQRTSVSDLTPLEGMPLKSLDLHRAEGVTDLRPLRGMPLEYLNLSHLTVSDLSLLKGMTSLERLALHDMKQLSDLKPLEGLRLRELDLLRTGVTDLSPLRGMALKQIVLPPVKNITQGLELLRGMKSLTTIGVAHDQIWPAAGFWERYDKGEFKE
jgi:serine/threonine protein kinase/Leucine-rich repeat (LRR) protein